MSNILIPPAALVAGARVLHANLELFEDLPWEDLSDADQDEYREQIRAAFLAMLENWPGMTWACRGKGTPPHLLFLPLPQEASDEPV
jgi:hypothetical protein